MQPTSTDPNLTLAEAAATVPIPSTESPAPAATTDQPAAAAPPSPSAPMPAGSRKRSALPYLASRIFGVPLAISAAKLQTILTVIGPRLLGFDEDVKRADMPAHRSMQASQDVAVISIVGTLIKRAAPGESMADQTYDEISAEFLKAVRDPSISAIVLDLDSPGGEVNGMLDLSDTIFKARGAKPILAVANEWATSAAYALASAADTVIVPRTGTVGSVGVIAVHVDQSAWDAQEGLKFTTITAGARKADFDPHAPLSEDAQKTLQTEVDRIYGLFVETVARNRGLSVEAVRKTQAAVYSGADAVQAGLADEVGTMDSALTGLLADQAKKMKATQERVNAVTAIKEAQDLNIQIAQLCQVAGVSHRTAEFLKRGLTVAQVQEELLRARATKDEAVEIISHVLPTTGLAVRPTMARLEDIYQRRRAEAKPRT